MKKLLGITCMVLFLAVNGFAGTNLTREKPIAIDKAKKSVSFLAQVNGKYFYQPTRHFAVYEKGKNGDKSVLKGLVHQLAFHDALVQVGAKSGDNMTMENKETTHVQGQAFKVTITWEGADREYTIDEVVKASTDNPIEMKFGGNYENAEKFNTGCLLCLDSCPVGVVSNAAYTYGAVVKRKEVTFMGNKAVLPPDGTLVVITLTLI